MFILSNFSAVQKIKKKIWLWFLDSFFPAYCLGCRKEGNFLCNECEKKLLRLKDQVCPWCYEPRPAGAACLTCLQHSDSLQKLDVVENISSSEKTENRFLDGVIVGSKFEQGSLLQRAIHGFKYDFIEELIDPLGNFLAETLKANLDILTEVFQTENENIKKSAGLETIYASAEASIELKQKNANAANLNPGPAGERLRQILLCPLPLHPKRLRWRGFNQSELLCREVARRFAQSELAAVAVEQFLKRVHFVRPQMELAREERMRNVEDVFALRDDFETPFIQEQTIFLVDDIATTLSTLNSAAKTLKKAGCKRVYGLVLARVF